MDSVDIRLPCPFSRIMKSDELCYVNEIYRIQVGIESGEPVVFCFFIKHDDIFRQRHFSTFFRFLFINVKKEWIRSDEIRIKQIIRIVCFRFYPLLRGQVNRESIVFEWRASPVTTKMLFSVFCKK